MKKLYYLILILLLFSMSSNAAPPLMNAQGRLTDINGDTLATGTYSVTFSIYDSELGGCPGDLNIRAIWGNSVDEVFLLMASTRIVPHPSCGDYFLLWWDGSEFHWF